MAEEIDEHTLLQRAAQAGVRVSADQLKRWRRAGLIPRPRQEHPRGRRGSCSRYRADTVAQLVAVARSHAATHRLGDLLVAVWWDGYWVERGALRRALGGRLDQISAQARAVRARHPDAFEAADEIVRSACLRDPSPPLALMRRRLPGGRGDLRELLWLFSVLGLGGEHEWSPDDEVAGDDAPPVETLLAQAAGIDRAQRESLAGHEPWLPVDVRARAVVLELRDAGAFELEDLGRPVHAATDAQLDQARDDARLFAERLAPIGQVLQALVGEDVAGVGSLAVLAIHDAGDRAAMIRTMLVLRRAAGDEAFARIRQTVEQHYGVFAAIQQLRAALPEHTHLLRPGGRERLADLPDSEATRVRDELNRYLTEHPHIARALDLDESSEAASP